MVIDSFSSEQSAEKKSPTSVSAYSNSDLYFPFGFINMAMDLELMTTKDRRNFYQQMLLQYMGAKWPLIHQDRDINLVFKKVVTLLPYQDPLLVPTATDELCTSNLTSPERKVPIITTESDTQSQLRNIFSHATECFVMKGIQSVYGFDHSVFTAEHISKKDNNATAAGWAQAPLISQNANGSWDGELPLRKFEEYCFERMLTMLKDYSDRVHRSAPQSLKHCFVEDWSRHSFLHREWMMLPTFLRCDSEDSLQKLQGETRVANSCLYHLSPGSFIPEHAPMPNNMIVLNCGPCPIRIRCRGSELVKTMTPNAVEKYFATIQNNISSTVLDDHGVLYNWFSLKPGELAFVPSMHRFVVKCEGVATVFLWRHAPMTAENFARIVLHGRFVGGAFRPLHLCEALVRIGRFTDRALYTVTKDVFLRLLMQEKTMTEYLQQCQLVVQNEGDMNTNAGFYQHSHSKNGYFCNRCQAEIYNTFIAIKEGALYCFFCIECAKSHINGRNEFIVVRKTPVEQLFALMDQFLLANE